MSKLINIPATNEVKIVGTLLEAEFFDDVTKAGKPYKRAKVLVRVTQKYNDVTEISEIPLSFFAMQTTSKGKPNPAYDGLAVFKEKCRPAQQVGLASADRIRVTKGQLEENMYVGRTGRLVTSWQVRGSFVDFASIDEPDCAIFSLEMVIADMRQEVDSDGDETGRLQLRSAIVQWGGKADVVELFVEKREHVDYIERNWGVNDTVIAGGYLRSSVEIKTISTEAEFGESLPTTTKRFHRDLVITTGKFAPDNYEIEDIDKALGERSARRQALLDGASTQGVAAVTASPAVPVEKPKSKYSWE